MDNAILQAYIDIMTLCALERCHSFNWPLNHSVDNQFIYYLKNHDYLLLFWIISNDEHMDMWEAEESQICYCPPV